MYLIVFDLVPGILLVFWCLVNACFLFIYVSHVNYNYIYKRKSFCQSHVFLEQQEKSSGQQSQKIFQYRSLKDNPPFSFSKMSDINLFSLIYKCIFNICILIRWSQIRQQVSNSNLSYWKKVMIIAVHEIWQKLRLS